MNVKISPEVVLAEANAKIEWLEQRCLLLRQAYQDAKAGAEKERDDKDSD